MKGEHFFFLTFLYLHWGCQHEHIMLKVFSHTDLDLKNVKASYHTMQQRFKWIGALWLALYVLLYDDFNANNLKCIQRVPQGQSSQSSQCLLRRNNRLLKCQPVSLRRKWKVVVLVGHHWGDVGFFWFFGLFFLFFCHLMAHGLGIISQG